MILQPELLEEARGAVAELNILRIFWRRNESAVVVPVDIALHLIDRRAWRTSEELPIGAEENCDRSVELDRLGAVDERLDLELGGKHQLGRDAAERTGRVVHRAADLDALGEHGRGNAEHGAVALDHARADRSGAEDRTLAGGADGDQFDTLRKLRLGGVVGGAEDDAGDGAVLDRRRAGVSERAGDGVGCRREARTSGEPARAESGQQREDADDADDHEQFDDGERAECPDWRP